MAINVYTQAQQMVNDARLDFCPNCWHVTRQRVRIGRPFQTPEGMTLRALIHSCAWCLDETETHYAGRIMGELYSGTWLDWESAGQSVGTLTELRRVRRSRSRR